jgi:indole-3-glycerol phosphate synthase
LISEILSDREIKQFIWIAASLDMDVLLEFHQVTELSKILNSNLNIIGINNRNLSTLETNPFHALEIRDMFINEFRDHDIVAESGISSTLIIDKYLSNGITKFLIGESLLRESF